MYCDARRTSNSFVSLSGKCLFWLLKKQSLPHTIQRGIWCIVRCIIGPRTFLSGLIAAYHFARRILFVSLSVNRSCYREFSHLFSFFIIVHKSSEISRFFSSLQPVGVECSKEE